jgi:hypothetical protein
VVNQLARSDPAAAEQLAELAAALLAAQQAGDGARLRELSAERAPLLDALAGAAFRAAGLTDPPPGLRAEVSATLEAALADPEVAAGMAAGTLTKGAEWAGFGPPAVGSPGVTAIRPATPGDEMAMWAVPDRGSGRGEPGARDRVALLPTDGDGATAEASRRTARQPTGDVAALDTARRPARQPAGDVAAPDTTRRPARQRVSPEEAAAARERRAAEEAQRLAAEAAEREARQRRAFEESERALADALAGTAEAETAEERLEAEVRALEERLTRARAELAAARLRARRAEAAERRARQAHDRLSAPRELEEI